MFVGHGVLAFAVAATVAHWQGWSADRALALGVLAAGFGTLPDVDMLYAPVGMLGGFEGLTGASSAFWDGAALIHRSTTHSLFVGAIAAAAATVWGLADAVDRAAEAPAHTTGSPRLSPGTVLRAIAVGSLAGLVALGLSLSGLKAGFVLSAFGLGVLALATAARRLRLGPGAVAGTALLGFLSHPFGDLVTGEPPALFYPLGWNPLESAVVLHPDPTLNLLGAFFLELAVLWLGLLVYAHLRGWRLRWAVSPRAGLGVGYAGAVLAIPPPTLEAPTAFVASVLALGILGVPIGFDGDRPRRWRATATALSAVTIAGLAYLAAYLALA